MVDAPTRMFHAAFALCFLGAYVTADGERLRLLHVTFGYSLAGLLAFRVVYGLVGPRHARLSGLVRKLGGLVPWLVTLRLWRVAPRTAAVNWRQGQNLSMAWVIVTLLGLVLPLTLSGYATYQEWGGDWLSEVHELLGNGFLALVLAHVGLVLVLSVVRRRNLAGQMFSGRAEGAGPDLVARNHGLLAALLLAGVLSFWVYQWQQSPEGLVSGAAWRTLWLSEHDDD
jgi:cytochrome b